MFLLLTPIILLPEANAYLSSSALWTCVHACIYMCVCACVSAHTYMYVCVCVGIQRITQEASVLSERVYTCNVCVIRTCACVSCTYKNVCEFVCTYLHRYVYLCVSQCMCMCMDFWEVRDGKTWHIDKIHRIYMYAHMIFSTFLNSPCTNLSMVTGACVLTHPCAHTRDLPKRSCAWDNAVVVRHALALSNWLCLHNQTSYLSKRTRPYDHTYLLMRARSRPTLAGSHPQQRS